MLVVCCCLAGVFAPRVVARALLRSTHRLFARHRQVVRVVRARRGHCFAFVARIATYRSRALLNCSAIVARINGVILVNYRLLK
jgi:hypothetical protein